MDVSDFEEAGCDPAAGRRGVTVSQGSLAEELTPASSTRRPRDSSPDPISPRLAINHYNTEVYQASSPNQRRRGSLIKPLSFTARTTFGNLIRIGFIVTI